MILVSIPGPSSEYLPVERLRVPGPVLAVALTELGPDPSIDEIAQVVHDVADRAVVEHRLEVDEVWALALSELHAEVTALEERFEARERSEAAAEADRIIDRVRRRPQRRHGVSITNKLGGG